MSVGVWFVGALGNIAITSMVGANAIDRGLTPPTGMVTERTPCTRLDLPDVGAFTFGGHDIADGSVLDRAERLADANDVPATDTVEAVREDLAAIDDRVRTGTALNCGEAVTDLTDAEPLEDGRSVPEIVERLCADYREFADENDLDEVVVVDVASTEPPVADPGRYDTREAVEAAIESGDDDLPASALYAYAALTEGFPFANFTPSAGSSLGGLRELADAEGVPHMGNDGKTGESLVKAALAPMFAMRNLRVRSWDGHNILGNTDGLVLEDEENEAGKIESKGGILDGILDDEFHNSVRIDYSPALNDWKTAWDYVLFDGFLDTRMKMQFTWEGSDSALAAPLTLDLARLLVHARENGESGLQPHLASFFKSPIAVEEHDLSRQFDRLYDYVERHAADRATDDPTETGALTD